jgi:PAS domain S-box-containing protein
MKLLVMILFLLINTFLLSSSTSVLETLTPQEIEFIKTHPKVVISNEKDWAPYDYNENGIAKGYSIDYIKLLAKKVGIELSFETHGWNDLIKMVKNKEIDLLHPASINEKRKEYLNFLESHIKYNLSLITSTQNKNIKSLKDMSGKVLAVGKGWATTKTMKDKYPKIIYKEYSTSKEKLVAVAYGEADATVESFLTATYIMKIALLNNLKIVSKIELGKSIKDLHIGIRKDWPILRDIFQKSMNSITEEEILKLNNKWFHIEKLEKNQKIEFSSEELLYLKSKKMLSMCIDPLWMPYEKISEGKHIGMSSDYFNIFRKDIPIPIVLKKTSSWAETIEFSKNRECDLISLAIKTPSREKFLSFTKTYLKVPLVVATKPDKPFVVDLQDIIHYKIGMVKGYAFIELLKNKYPNLNVIEVNSVSEGLTLVSSNKIYGFVDSLSSIGYKVQEEYLGSIRIAGKIDQNFEMGIAIRKDHPILLNIFNKVISNLTNEQHRDILNKWVSVRYDKEFDSSLLLKLGLIVFFVALFLIYRQNMLRKQNNVLIDAQKKLQESNEEFGHLINSTMEAIFVWKEGKCINANFEAIKLFGYKNKDDILGITTSDIFPLEMLEIVKQKLLEKESKPYELSAIKNDGTIFPVLIKGHNFELKNSLVRVSAIIDLTELKYKEKLLTEQTKMVALGEMLGNIAHQWRQPLSVISTAASGLQIQKEMDMLSDEMFDESMEAIVLNTGYLSNTINDFTNFIKDDKLFHRFNLKEHMEKNLKILKSMLAFAHIKVILNIDNSIFINNYENELSQVIMNIVTNAKDAFVQRDIEDRIIFIHSFMDENEVSIFIRDNAGGIPENIINKIFEPYFTTKHKYQGTGIGLYMTNKIITESMKGAITVKNDEYEYNDKVYKGALFRLTL